MRDGDKTLEDEQYMVEGWWVNGEKEVEIWTSRRRLATQPRNLGKVQESLVPGTSRGGSERMGWKQRTGKEKDESDHQIPSTTLHSQVTTPPQQNGKQWWWCRWWWHGDGSKHIRGILCVKHSSKLFTYISSFNPNSHLWGIYYYYLHFTHDETEPFVQGHTANKW